MLWIDGFTAEGRKKVLRFMHENEQAMKTVMESKRKAKSITKFGKVEDLQILPGEYRPGARGKLWVWEDGVGREMVPQTIEKDVGFNVHNIREAAKLIGYKDKRGMQMLTRWGATQGTEFFPLNTYGAAITRVRRPKLTP